MPGPADVEGVEKEEGTRGDSPPLILIRLHDPPPGCPPHLLGETCTKMHQGGTRGHPEGINTSTHTSFEDVEGAPRTPTVLFGLWRSQATRALREAGKR